MNYDDIEDAILSHAGKFHREQWLADKKQADKINTIASITATLYSSSECNYSASRALEVALDLYKQAETRVKNEAKDE
jgi:hypothetical protein